MKRKNVRIRDVSAAQKSKAWRWLRDARSHHRQAEENQRRVRAYVRGKEPPTREDRALLREAAQLVRDTRDRMIYMEGVVMGVALLDNAISQRLIASELDPFGGCR